MSRLLGLILLVALSPLFLVCLFLTWLTMATADEIAIAKQSHRPTGPIRPIRPIRPIGPNDPR